MSLAERFGWTWDELMDQDMAQVLPSVAASNIYAALHRFKGWVEAAAKNPDLAPPSDDDGRIWRAVVEAQQRRDKG